MPFRTRFAQLESLVDRAADLRRSVPSASKTITVVVLGDTAAEGTEGFSVLLSNPTGATIVDGSGAGTITDDEAA